MTMPQLSLRSALADLIMLERISLAVIVGQHRQIGAADTGISLTFNWSFGDAPNGERAIADTQTKAYRIAYIR